MSPKEKELLGRIDERIKAMDYKLDTVLSDNTEQWKVLNNHKQELTRHTTYFKVIGYVLGSGTILTILANGILAYIK